MQTIEELKNEMVKALEKSANLLGGNIHMPQVHFVIGRQIDGTNKEQFWVWCNDGFLDAESIEACFKKWPSKANAIRDELAMAQGKIDRLKRELAELEPKEQTDAPGVPGTVLQPSEVQQ